MLSRFRQILQEEWRATQRALIKMRSDFADMMGNSPQRVAPQEASRRDHAGRIIDLFATIMGRVDGISIDDTDISLEMLRYDFPNVEHSWILRRFDNVYRAKYPLESTLTLAAAKLSEEERISLALESYVMLYRVGADVDNPDLFEKICFGLNIPHSAKRLEELITQPTCSDAHPIERLSVSSSNADCDFALSARDEPVEFRALRCVNLVIIINDAQTPISILGQSLRKGDIHPLRIGQDIELLNSPLSHASILFLMQAKYAGVTLVNYLHLDDDSLCITRQRNLNSIVRIKRNMQVSIDILRKDVKIELDGKLITSTRHLSFSYYSSLSIDGHGPYICSDIAHESRGDRSFQLDPGNRKILVSNLPSMNRPGALILSPGLASKAVFEVSYTRASNSGELRIIEGCESLLIDGKSPKDELTPLKDGSRVSLSINQHLRCRFAIGVLDEESSIINKLRVEGLSKDFVRAGRVVDNIDFSLARDEMACILGPSGSGKSTLLAMLAGQTAPSYGRIFYNNERLSPDSGNLRRHIAYIPREDILDEAMSVSEHIYQASVIRRPKLKHSDRMRRVLAVLNFVGVSHLAQRRVGRASERRISDGERTRVNLGLDLTGTAEVFLIDEPISGLSSIDSERVIDTLEDMAQERILLCTLHRPAGSLLARFKKVMVLDRFGQMAFWGSPKEMQRYFQTAARELKLNISHEATAAGGADYVFEVLEAPSKRLSGHRSQKDKIWQDRYENYSFRQRLQNSEITPQLEEEKPIPKLPHRSLIELWRHFIIWIARTLLARVRSRLGLYTMLLEGPLLALLIGGTLRAASERDYTFYKALHINEYLFLSLVLAMFFGLTDAACEILRDRPLLRRESNYKIFVPGYLLSKVLVLTGIAATQCALYLLVSNWILEIYSMYWIHLAVMVLTAFVGISISLMVSAFARSERMALNIVPLVLVPQILLAGAVIKFEQMNDVTPTLPNWSIVQNISEKFARLRHRVAYQDSKTHNIETKPIPLIAELCPLRYAFEMIFVAQSSLNLWERESLIITELRDELKEYGSEEELRFIQRAALSLNAIVLNEDDAENELRRIRKAALKQKPSSLDKLDERQEALIGNEIARPLEFFYSNLTVNEIRQGIKSARKDARINESRGFFLAPRQARPFSEIDQNSDEGSISTIWRNGFYLFLMGLIPILACHRKLRLIGRGK